MSFPNIPNVTASINISREGAINLLLASIAFEELGLAHIINAEAEKIQAALGTLPDQTAPLATSIAELNAVNESVNKTLKTVIKKEMLLQFKLEDVLNLLPCQILLQGRRVLSTIPGSSQQNFVGFAQGTNQVSVQIFVNGIPQGVATQANVLNNQFNATVTVPEGLPPGTVITVRASSVEHPECLVEQLVSSVPILP